MQEEVRFGLYALAIVALGVLAAIFAWKGNGEAAVATAANIVSLLVRPPSMRGPSIPLPATALCLVLLAGCQSDPHSMEMGIRIGTQSVASRPLAGYRVAAISLEPKASTPLSGEAGLWASSADGIPRLVDVAGNEYKAGAVGRGVSVGAPSGVALGQCWTDSTDSYKLYCKESGGNLAQRFSALAPGPIGCGGTPNTGCFTSLTSTATTTLGDAAADVVTIKGALRVENAANTFHTALTTGAAANRAVAFPDAAGTVVLDSATQTLTNKTHTAPVLGGTVTGTYTLGGTPTIGVNTAATSGITLTVGANVLIGAVADKLNAAMLAIASQATGDILYANSASTFARLADVATGSVLTSGGVGVAPAWGTTGSLTGLYAGQWLGHASGNLTAGATKYLMTGDSGGEANNPRSLHLSAVAMQALNLSCTLQTEPGLGESVVFTVIKSTDRAATWSDTSATCTISGTANECSDSTNHPTTAQYDLLGVKIVNSNNGVFAAADAHCTVHMAK